MKFRDLAEIFQKLENTASRNAMTQILSDLLKEAKDDEVKEIVYLSLGQLGPSFARVQFNLAEKQVQKALAEVYGESIEGVNKKYKEIGDLGSLAQELAEGKKRNGGVVEVREVYENLLLIAKDEGMGSQERKISGLASVLSLLDPLSSRFAVRMVMGRLRLGFSDKTILDALSVMEKGDKSIKKELELAYQIRSDIGSLAEEVK